MNITVIMVIYVKIERGSLRKSYPKVRSSLQYPPLLNLSIASVDAISIMLVHLDSLRSKCGVFENEVARVKPKS